ncbi:MAG: hypothetical protein PHG47_11205 [Sulfuricella sp.]|nr:hypothetical protein [Sulfuricella sp.]
MRFVPSLPPVTAPVEEEKPRAIRAIRPVRRVEARMRVPVVVQNFRRKVRPEEETAGEPVAQEKRTAVDRRKWCRRLLHGSSVLDTRSGEDRRKKRGRSGDIATTLDEKA